MVDEDYDEGQGIEEENEGTDEPVQEDGELFNRWLSLIDEVSELTRLDFNKVWLMNVNEFFTYASYNRWKSKKKMEAMEKWKRQH